MTLTSSQRRTYARPSCSRRAAFADRYAVSSLYSAPYGFLLRFVIPVRGSCRSASVAAFILIVIVASGCGSTSTAHESADTSRSVDSEVWDDSCSRTLISAQSRQSEGSFTERRSPDGRHERVFTASDGSDGRVDVSALPFSTPATERARRATTEFILKVRQNVNLKGWGDPDVARAEGFEPSQPCSTHWVNPAYVSDGRLLDPTRPEYLVFYPDDSGTLRLTSAMFTALGGSHGPQLFGTQLVWHYHIAGAPYTFCSAARTAMVYLPRRNCPPRQRRTQSSEMLHVGLSYKSRFCTL